MKKIIISISLFFLFGISLIYATWTIGWQNGFKATSVEKTVDAHGICKKVKKTTGLDVFIPTKTSEEWQVFRDNKPYNVELNDCKAPCYLNTSFLTSLKLLYVHKGDNIRYYVAGLSSDETVIGYSHDNTSWQNSKTYIYNLDPTVNMGYMRAKVRNSTGQERYCYAPYAVKIVPDESCNIIISNNSPKIGDTVTFTQTNSGFIDSIDIDKASWKYCEVPNPNYYCPEYDYVNIGKGLSTTFKFKHSGDYRFVLNLSGKQLEPYSDRQRTFCDIFIKVQN